MVVLEFNEFCLSKSMVQVITKKKTSPRKYKVWECGTCTKLLGIIYPNGVLCIKFKDLTCWVVGQAKIVCRFCKTINTYRTSVNIEDVVDDTDINDGI